MKKPLLTLALLSAFSLHAEIVQPLQINNALGVDENLDYSLLKEMGPWDDRNYQLSKEDIAILPYNDQQLSNVPVFYKVEYRKAHPETGKYYPRSLYQLFTANYGGLVVDGVWYQEGLGLAIKDKSYGRVPAEVQIRIAANETAIESGVLGDESAIECNPTNKNNCVAGTNTMNGQTMYYSSNGGATWTKSQTNPSQSCCDPTVDWSADGSIVYQGDLQRDNSNNIAVRWSRSLDQGHTWEAMKQITGLGGHDKEFIHVDRSATSSHKDNVYMTWHTNNTLQFARSTDKGLTFSSPLSFSSEPQGIGSDITTDSAGNVYYFYPSTNSNSGIRMLKSTNGGATFSSGSRVAILNDSFDISVPSMETRNTFIYTSADVDKNNDTIYVAWTDGDDDSANGTNANTNHTKIRLAKSTNGGSSWTECATPHDTSDSLAAGNAVDRYHPWVKVADDSSVHIGYYDTRHSSNRTGVDFYYSYSTNACSSWTESRFTSSTSSNLTDGQEWGDYNGLSIVLDKMVMTWTDNRSGKATFAGTGTPGQGGGTIPPQTGNTLENNVAVTGLSGSTNNDKNYTLAVPAGASNLAFTLSGGTGDADLYVKFGSAPTTSSYDCRSWTSGNGETCNISSAQAGTYHVLVHAYATYSGADLKGSYTSGATNTAPTAAFSSSCSDLTCSFDASASSDNEGAIASYSWSFGGSGATASHTYSSAGSYNVTLTVTDSDGATDTISHSVTVTAPPVNNNQLSNGVAKTNLSAAKNAQLNYTMVVPAGASNLKFALSGGTGDADLYVKFGSAPTTSNYDCRSWASGNTETCNISTAQTGTYYVMINAYAAFSGANLTGSFTTGGGSQQSLFSNASDVNIPDNNSTGATSSISVNRTGNAGTVKITYDIIHTYRGDLTVKLVAANGSTVTLRSPSGGGTNNINESKTIDASSSNASGTWKLKVIDGAAQDTGYINSWSIEFL